MSQPAAPNTVPATPSSTVNVSTLSSPAVIVSTPSAPSRPVDMSADDTTHPASSVPMLTKENYPRWRMQVRGYLCVGDHGRVIKRTADPQGNMVDPVEPADADELKAW